MTAPSTTDEDDEHLREEARQWLVRVLQKDTPALRHRLQQWRDANPKHDEAYRRAERTWQAAQGAAERLAAREHDELSIYLEQMDQAKSRSAPNRRSVISGLILAFAIASGIVWLERPGLMQDLFADHVSKRGERMIVGLPDNSTALLDADSALDEDYRPGERRVRLLRGAAYFDVSPSQIPFVVQTADGEVHVLGTRFDVRLQNGGATITLETGRVAVSNLQASGGQTKLEPGQQVQVGGERVGRVEAVDVDDVLAWREGRFVFYRARFADIIAEIERYRPGRIVVTSSTLADERVTGSFMLDNADEALAALQASVGFQMTTLAGRLTVIRR